MASRESSLTGGSHSTVENIEEEDVVDPNHNVSIARSSTTGASLQRLFSMSSASHSHQLDEELENEIVSQAGDSGDFVLRRRGSDRKSGRFSMEQGTVFPIPEQLLETYGFWSRDHVNANLVSPVTPLASDFVTPPPTNTLLRNKQEEEKELPPFVEYCIYLVHLAVFGILGVMTRYLLQKLFGSILHVTSDGSILYLDLPSNIVGSFLMGWFGVVFKSNISHMSDHLAVGLTTGYLGSLTTFSGWNQKMLELSVNGHWVFAVLGFIIGLFLAAYSIIFGIETAKGFRWLLRRTGICTGFSKLRVNSIKKHMMVLSILVLFWAGLWTTSGILEKREFKNGGSVAQLWLGCLVGPIGVWIRWWLARLNGRGLGKAERWKWLPFGTLAANISAACIMAALATVKKAVNTKDCETIVAGIQFGLMGCLSTVSTFIAEFNAMRMSSHPWRAYVYALTTIFVSFVLGTLVFSVPVWTMGYDHTLNPYPSELCIIVISALYPASIAEENAETSNRDLEFVEVGYVSNVHGLDGEIHVKHNTDFPDLRFSETGKRWLRRQISGREDIFEVELVAGRDHPGSKSWIVKLRGFDSVDEARQLVGATFLVRNIDRPELEEGEYYSRDLVGMRVILKDTVGSVINVFNTVGNDLLLESSTGSPGGSPKQKLEKSEALHHVWIPFVEAIVPDVDMDRREMRILHQRDFLS